MTVSLERTARVIRTEAGCWEWQGAKSSGYGKVGLSGGVYYLHRLLYELWWGRRDQLKVARLKQDREELRGRGAA